MTDAFFGEILVFREKLCPVFRASDFLFNVTLLTGVPTVILHRAFTEVPFTVAVMAALPFLFAVTFPFLDTVATLRLLLLHFTPFRFAALFNSAFNFTVFPFFRVYTDLFKDMVSLFVFAAACTVANCVAKNDRTSIKTHSFLNNLFCFIAITFPFLLITDSPLISLLPILLLLSQNRKHFCREWTVHLLLKPLLLLPIQKSC